MFFFIMCIRLSSIFQTDTLPRFPTFFDQIVFKENISTIYNFLIWFHKILIGGANQLFIPVYLFMTNW